MIKSKDPKTKISRTHSLILTLSHSWLAVFDFPISVVHMPLYTLTITLPSPLWISLVVMMRSMEIMTSRLFSCWFSRTLSQAILDGPSTNRPVQDLQGRIINMFDPSSSDDHVTQVRPRNEVTIRNWLDVWHVAELCFAGGRRCSWISLVCHFDGPKLVRVYEGLALAWSPRRGVCRAIRPVVYLLNYVLTLEHLSLMTMWSLDWRDIAETEPLISV